MTQDKLPIPSKDHHVEVFSNKFGSTKAVVCSCGFATTYSVLSNDADEQGRAFFNERHAELLPEDVLRDEPSAKCTCHKDGSMRCKFPHPCRRCYVYHPGVSCYWNGRGKTGADKPEAGRTFARSDGSLGCGECCNGDRCDDHTHYNRDSCPFCLGSGSPKLSPVPPSPTDCGGLGQAGCGVCNVCKAPSEGLIKEAEETIQKSRNMLMEAIDAWPLRIDRYQKLILDVHAMLGEVLDGK
jgi:hypothetical protein